MNHTIDSVCTYCGVGCDIRATINENSIVKISADPFGLVSRGKLCIKGKEGYDYLDNYNRPRGATVKKTFVDNNPTMPLGLRNAITSLPIYKGRYNVPYALAYDIAAWKFRDIITRYGQHAVMGMGGARTNCESGFLFQKFIRQVIGSPHIDNCARVCHSPSLAGMRSIIGEGAATNPFDDIALAEFIIVIGSNTTEAHPIVANRMLDAKKRGLELAVIDIRPIQLAKKADWSLIIPTEANLMVLNMIARIIVEEDLINHEFIASRTRGFDEYKEKLLSDPYSNPNYFSTVSGYEELATLIPTIAKLYATKRSMIFWGLGITEHLDGSYTAEALSVLSLLTGNIGSRGKGLMPLRGQNNVQGTCDVGCLPYYLPDYKKPEHEGLKTPEALDAMIRGEIRALWNIGEDILHIHANLSKVEKALDSLELIIVNEVAPALMVERSDICFGVKSAYEKDGVYVNAERRLHLSAPLIHSELPDDWETLQEVAKRLGEAWNFTDTQEVWEAVRQEVGRYKGATYTKLKMNNNGLQWPVDVLDTPILHIHSFRTKDGLGHFKYRPWEYRGQIAALKENRKIFTLSTGRLIAHYNNAAQTRATPRLVENSPRDTLLIHPDDAKELGLTVEKQALLTSAYGMSAPLDWKGVKEMKRGVVFSTFHFHESRINYLFGDEADVVTQTSRFKAVEIIITPHS